MADRNVWDPPTPSTFIEFSQRGLVVELYIYRFEKSAKDDDAIRKDVEDAAKIWCQSKINIQVAHLDKIPPFTAVEPLDLSVDDLARNLSCSGMTPQVRDQFLSIPRPGNPNIRRSIAVFYIPGTKFQDGGSGCHQYKWQGTDGEPEHFILATDAMNGRVLAHEVGHALLVQKIPPPENWANADPDPERDPNSPGHNTNAQNLMFPSVPQNPIISDPQQAVAKSSLLVSEQMLVFGFKDSTFRKLAVTIKTLNVTQSSDEWTSDDELESEWKFRVSTIRKSDGAVLLANTKLWTKDPLDWQEYTLNLDYPLLPLTSDDDELKIEVTGTDWDFWSPNDIIRPITKVWAKKDAAGTEVLWGMASTNIPGGQNGDHVESVATETINYSVTYNVKPDDVPETRFRTIC
jgi:hypothetical protein